MRNSAILLIRISRFLRRRSSKALPARRDPMNASIAATSSGTPFPRTASVRRIGISRRDRSPSSKAVRRSCSRRSAPPRSALLITRMSAISSTPDFMAWMPSPDSGESITITQSAARETSISDWPTPTVSSRITVRPEASSRSAASWVARARPPLVPRVAIERMKTSPVSVLLFMRIRSPRRAPPVKGLVGSTAMTATFSPRSR